MWHEEHIQCLHSFQGWKLHCTMSSLKVKLYFIIVGVGQNKMVFFSWNLKLCKSVKITPMCQGGGFTTALLFCKLVGFALFLQEVKSHSMCICSVCVIMVVLLTHIILQLVMSVTIFRYLISVSIGHAWSTFYILKDLWEVRDKL